MLGLLSGFLLSGGAPLPTVIAACVGAAVALGVSGLTSAYLSESAERRRSLAELESAMITDLQGSSHARAAKLLPWLVALVNGASPLMVSLLIIAPLWLARSGVPLPFEPLLMGIITAFASIFGLGIFLGRVAGTSWLLSGIKTLLIALATMLLILLL
jgi:predicted membrane protein (TIGR00267 family)